MRALKRAISLFLAGITTLTMMCAGTINAGAVQSSNFYVIGSHYDDYYTVYLGGISEKDLSTAISTAKNKNLMWSVLLDKVAFKHECFYLRTTDDIFKPCDVGYHLLDLWGLLVSGLEVLMNPVIQIYGFTYIYNMVSCIMHEINPWNMGEFLKLFFKIKHYNHLKNLK